MNISPTMCTFTKIPYRKTHCIKHNAHEKNIVARPVVFLHNAVVNGSGVQKGAA